MTGGLIVTEMTPEERIVHYQVMKRFWESVASHTKLAYYKRYARRTVKQYDIKLEKLGVMKH